MADEDKKVEEEVTEEEVKVETEATEAEAKEEADAAKMEEFDSKIDDTDSEEDDSADDDDGEEEAAKKEPPAKEEAAKVTSEEDSINAAADDLEKEIEAEFAKTDEQKADEKAEAEKVKADEDAAQAKKDEEEAEKPYDCGLGTDEGEYEPELVEALNKQGQAQQDRAVVAEKANEELTTRLDQASADRNADWLDRKFEALGENFDEVLGKGEFDDLEIGGTQRANRIAVSKRMGAVMRAYAKAEKAIPTRTKLFSMAVDNLFNKETKQPETDKKAIAGAKKRAGNVLGGGGKKATTVSAEQQASKVQRDFDAKIDAE
jgi:hypothetical protein